MSVVEPNSSWIDASKPDAWVRIKDLVGREDVSIALGVSRSQAYSWSSNREKTGFPRPVIGSDSSRQNVKTAVYYMPAILDWYAAWSINKDVGGPVSSPTASDATKASAQRMRDSRARAFDSCVELDCGRKGKEEFNGYCEMHYYDKVLAGEMKDEQDEA